MQIDQKEQADQLAHKKTICVHYIKMFNNNQYVKLYVKRTKNKNWHQKMNKEQKKQWDGCA